MKGDLYQSELCQAQNLSMDEADWGENMRKMAGQLEEEEEEEEGEDGRGKERKKLESVRRAVKWWHEDFM